MNRQTLPIILLGIAIILAMVAGLLFRGEKTTEFASLSLDDQVNQVAGQLYCPVCANTPLDACGTEACIRWREIIREQLVAGHTEQEIYDYFVAEYGERVLASPPVTQRNLLFWVLPVVIFAILVAALVLMFLRQPVSPQLALAEDDEPPGDDDDPYRAQLERDLEDLE